MVNAVLIPRGLYHSMFLPRDEMFQKIDQRAKDFVTMAKGIDPKYNATHVVAAQKKGGLGLHQMYGHTESGASQSCRARYGIQVTRSQTCLSHHGTAPGRDPHRRTKWEAQCRCR